MNLSLRFSMKGSMNWVKRSMRTWLGPIKCLNTLFESTGARKKSGFHSCVMSHRCGLGWVISDVRHTNIFCTFLFTVHPTRTGTGQPLLVRRPLHPNVQPIGECLLEALPLQVGHLLPPRLLIPFSVVQGGVRHDDSGLVLSGAPHPDPDRKSTRLNSSHRL